jgi:hypothetical protein
MTRKACGINSAVGTEDDRRTPVKQHHHQGNIGVHREAESEIPLEHFSRQFVFCIGDNSLHVPPENKSPGNVRGIRVGDPLLDIYPPQRAARRPEHPEAIPAHAEVPEQAVAPAQADALPEQPFARLAARPEHPADFPEQAEAPEQADAVLGAVACKVPSGEIVSIIRLVPSWTITEELSFVATALAAVSADCRSG